MPRNTFQGLGRFNAPVTYPASTGATAASSVSNSLDSNFLAPFENGIVYLVDAPALTGAQLPSGATVTFNLIFSDTASLASGLIGSLQMGVQTGVSTNGASAATFSTKLTSGGTTGKYVGLQVTASASTQIGSFATSLYAAAIDIVP